MARPTKQVIEYRVYELEPDKPYLCLAGDQWRISDVLSDRLHFHNCLEIGFCLSDSGDLHFENDMTVPFAAGDIFLIPRFVPHTTCSAKGCRSRWAYLFIDVDAVSSMVRRCGESSLASLMGNFVHLTPASDERLYFLCRCILEEAMAAAGDDTLFTLYVITLTAELRRKFSAGQNHADKRSRSFALRPALEYINEHYTEPCSTERLSSLCFLSQTHFRRLFLSIMGTSPLQYVIMIRIRQACILLNTTDEPISAIAQAVGMSSISSFNRNFQQMMGVSPQQYRNQKGVRKIPRTRSSILTYKGWMLPE